MLRAFRGGAWHSVTWGEYGRMAASCARQLRAAGVGPGDRVVLVSENRPEYPVAELALLALRAVPVPAYTSNTIEDHAHILRDSGARAAIVSNAALVVRLGEAGRLAGGLDLLVVMDAARAPLSTTTRVGLAQISRTPCCSVVSCSCGRRSRTVATIQRSAFTPKATARRGLRSRGEWGGSR